MALNATVQMTHENLDKDQSCKVVASSVHIWEGLGWVVVKDDKAPTKTELVQARKAAEEQAAPQL